MKDDLWANVHKKYSQADWAAKPSLFAETVKDYVPANGSLLELGAGLGQDSAYFAGLGYDVISTDINTEKLEQLAGDGFAVRIVDLRQPLPFDGESFDVVYAHLSLHYFDHETTEQIFKEIHRVLKPGGILAFLVNSLDDPEYGAGTEIESDYFDIQDDIKRTQKRFFSVESAKEFADGFEPLLADNDGETYKDRAKGVHNLIRYIGRKA